MAPACFVLLPDFSQVDVCQPEVLFPVTISVKHMGPFILNFVRIHFLRLENQGEHLVN